ncbi:MAG: hypothetical protein AABZ06_14225 [Bdellovibrionota bacterium]
MIRSCAVVLLAFFLVETSWANLQVFPTRLVLTDHKKTGHLSLKHVGDKQERYKITAVFYRMNSDGGMQLVEHAAYGVPESAVRLLRFSPREVTLNPNVEQILRVMFFSRDKIEDGEYRAHLHFEPVVEPVGSENQSAAKNPKDGGLTMQLQAKIAVAVPVIYRRGNPKALVRLSDPKLVKFEDGKSGFSVSIHREGKAFLFGDFNVFFRPSSGGEQTLVGLINGVSSYIDLRVAKYPLSPPDGFKMDSGKLVIEYREPVSDGGKVEASAELAIP